MIKIKDKKKFLKIIIIILLVILLLCLMFATRKKAEQQVVLKTQYTSINDFTSPEEVIVYMGSKYIKQENNPFKIYAKFKCDLFTDGNSNEQYFGQMIYIIANVLNYQNYQLIDNSKDIVITVMGDTETREITQIYINGDSNYYGNIQSLENLKNYKEKPNTDININADIIQDLIDNNWEINSLALGNYNETANSLGDVIREYTKPELEIKVIGTQGYSVVFKGDKNQNEKIINDLTVNASLEEVIYTLGKPTYGSLEDNVIGYKNSEIYVFFSNSEVSVYRIDKAENSEKLDEIFNKYLEDRNVKEFVSSITDLWSNYDLYYYDENTVDLRYIQKGVKVQYSITNNHGIIFYDNYVGKILGGKNLSELSKEENITTGAFIFFSDIDLISEYEIERVFEREINKNIQDDGNPDYLEEDEVTE